jgi:hypothetical protein
VVLTLDHEGNLEAEDVVRGVLDHLNDSGDDVVDDVEGGAGVDREWDTIAVEGVDGWEVWEAGGVVEQRRYRGQDGMQP